MIAGYLMMATDDTHATTVDSGSGRYILGLSGLAVMADAPSDGSTYGRRDGEWTGTGLGSGGSSANRTIEHFTPTSGQTAFTLTGVPSGGLDLFVNGLRYLSGVDFSVSSGALTWLDADFSLDTSDRLAVWYYDGATSYDYVTVSGVTVTVSGVAVWV